VPILLVVPRIGVLQRLLGHGTRHCGHKNVVSDGRNTACRNPDKGQKSHLFFEARFRWLCVPARLHCSTAVRNGKARWGAGLSVPSGAAPPSTANCCRPDCPPLRRTKRRRGQPPASQRVAGIGSEMRPRALRATPAPSHLRDEPPARGVAPANLAAAPGSPNTPRYD
jgi:hypothetical protein